jgi:hypothetical protein
MQAHRVLSSPPYSPVEGQGGSSPQSVLVMQAPSDSIAVIRVSQSVQSGPPVDDPPELPSELVLPLSELLVEEEEAEESLEEPDPLSLLLLLPDPESEGVKILELPLSELPPLLAPDPLSEPDPESELPPLEFEEPSLEPVDDPSELPASDPSEGSCPVQVGVVVGTAKGTGVNI